MEHTQTMVSELEVYVQTDSILDKMDLKYDEPKPLEEIAKGLYANPVYMQQEVHGYMLSEINGDTDVLTKYMGEWSRGAKEGSKLAKIENVPMTIIGASEEEQMRAFNEAVRELSEGQSVQL